MDQTGIHLVPSSKWTYEAVGSSSVAVLGAEDKRQITACIASSLHGDLLPLQLIFQGKTPRSLPPVTPESLVAQVHLTFTDNHWSSQATMQQYISEVIMPHAERCITSHRLSADAQILLVLDVWAVHKSEEFRMFLRSKHPRIHLVFVPANCTSRLQVADVVLQRPFKHGITSRFNQWAASLVAEQIADDKIIGLSDALKMSVIKPMVLDWCVGSWKDLKERNDLIKQGWKKCCLDLYDVNCPQKRTDALAAVIEKKLEMSHLPDGEEQDAESAGEHDESDDDDVLDIAKPRIFGKQGTRNRTPALSFGYQIASSAVVMTEDSE